MYRLLIVDDEPAIVEGLATMLGTAQLPLKEIKLAYSAREALAYFDEAPFDIILADIRMPKMDGLQMIDTIRGKSPATKIIFLSGYSDFEYARQAVRLGACEYLLKPVEDADVVLAIRKAISVLDKEYESMLSLEKARLQIVKAMNSLKEEFFRKLFEREILPEEDVLSEKFRYFNIPFNAGMPVASSILFRIDEWDSHFDPGDEPLIQFSVENILGELLGEICSLASFHIEKGLVAILIQAKGDTGPESISNLLKQKLEEAQDTIYRVLGVVVSFAVIPRPLFWDRWPEELIKLVSNMKLHLGKGMLIVMEKETGKSDSAEMSGLIRDIVEAINLKDVAAFDRHFDRAIHEISSTAQSAAGALGSVFMAVSAHILDQARKYNLIGFFRPENMEKMTNLYKHKNMEEMKAFMLEMLKLLSNMVESYRKNPAEAIVNQVKNYVNSHLNEDLSLNVLAGKVYMNSSYLSRIFSQHTQEQLSVYITRVKMEYAKTLLQNEELKIYEISQKVGYENPNYFAKVFRKSFGILPQDFRTLNYHMNK